MAPESITDHRARGVLALGWADGSQHTVAYRALRLLCPCAHCKLLRAQSAADAAWDSHIPQDLTVTGMQAVGSYGVQFGFSDGHDRGIFPWSFLRVALAAPCVVAI